MKFTFTWAHGKTQVERGFNVNSDILVENLSTLSITSQRAIYDFMNTANCDPQDFIMDDELRRSYLNARSEHYIKIIPKRKKNWKRQIYQIHKLDAKLNYIATVNRLKQETFQTIESLEKDVFASYDKAETHMEY